MISTDRQVVFMGYRIKENGIGETCGMNVG